MAPEAPAALVVLDIDEAGEEFVLHVRGWDPTGDERLFVLWNAITAPRGYESVAGIVYVAASPSYQPYAYDAHAPASTDRLVLTWRHWTPPGGALMLVAALPAGYAFAEALDGSPEPIEAKAANDRVVVFWRVTESGGGDVRWRIEPLGARSPRDAAAALNDQLPTPYRRPFDPEPQPPAINDLLSWAANRPPTTLGPPVPLQVFNISGGPVNVAAGDVNWQQSWNQIEPEVNLSDLAAELSRLRDELAAGPSSQDHERAVAEVEAAVEAARSGNGPRVLALLSRAGKWVLNVATQIGVPVATAALKQALGVP
jgi:hypothetical protein